MYNKWPIEILQHDIKQQTISQCKNIAEYDTQIPQITLET